MVKGLPAIPLKQNAIVYDFHFQEQDFTTTPPLGWIELLLFKLPKHDSNWYGTRTLLTKNEPPRPKKSIRDR